MSVFVIRTNEVDRTRQFFERFGMVFVAEKHGDGPVHYACVAEGEVFEIYPTEKKPTVKFIDP